MAFHYNYYVVSIALYRAQNCHYQIPTEMLIMTAVIAGLDGLDET